MKRTFFSTAFLALAAAGFSTPTLSHKLQASPQDLISRVPANANIVCELNFEPSARQKTIFAFLTPVIENFFHTQVGNSFPLPKDIREALTGGMSKGWIFFAKGDGKALAANPMAALSGMFGGLIPLADPSKAESALEAYDKKVGSLPKYWRGAKYHDLGQFKVMSGTDAITLSSDEKTFAEVKSGAKFVDTPGYAAARARYDADANLLLMIRPLAPGLAWGGAALTVRDEGIGLTVGPFSPGLLNGYTLPSNFASSMPRGAYAVVGIANPFNLFSGFPGGPKKKTVDEDAKAGLAGNAIVALYPSEGEGASAKGLDLLVELDGANGANPVGMLAKHLAKFQKMVPGADKMLNAIEIAGAQVAKELAGGFDALMNMGAKPGEKKHGMANLPFLAGKTIAFATVGDKVVVSTSRGLLSNAVYSLRNHQNTLAEDPMMGKVLSGDGRGIHMVLAGNFAQLGQVISSVMGPSASAITNVLKLSSSPLYFKVSGARDGAMANVFVPLTPDLIRMFMSVGSKEVSR